MSGNSTISPNICCLLVCCAYTWHFIVLKVLSLIYWTKLIRFILSLKGNNEIALLYPKSSYRDVERSKGTMTTAKQKYNDSIPWYALTQIPPMSSTGPSVNSQIGKKEQRELILFQFILTFCSTSPSIILSAIFWNKCFQIFLMHGLEMDFNTHKTCTVIRRHQPGKIIQIQTKLN